MEPEEGKEYCDVSSAELFAIFVLTLPIDVVFTHVLDEPFRGFVAALSAGVVLLVGWVLRPLARKPAFWICMAVMALLHLTLVYWLPYSGDFSFGFVFFPVAALDIFGFAKMTIYVCRRTDETL